MIEVETIHVHPDYESNSSDADIAVLELSESVEFTKYIRPLCLWNTDDNLNNVVGEADVRNFFDCYFRWCILVIKPTFYNKKNYMM